MPHQCLNCGETFADGSSDLLKGCPGCEGTRFFFTEDPLDEEEREELQEQTGKNVQEMLEDVLEDADKPDRGSDIWSREAWEDWIRLRRNGADEAEIETEIKKELGVDDDTGVAFEPLTSDEEKQDLRESEAVQVSLEDVQETEAPAPEAAGADDAAEHNGDGLEPAIVDEAADQAAIEAATESDVGGRPSTLNITEPGQYEIDVQRLMEDSPVIVERDGSYVIHLPSVFERGNKKR